MNPHREWCRRGGYDILCVDIYKRTTSETLADFIEHGCVLDNASQAFVRPLCVHRTTSASTFILMHSADGTYERTCRRARGGGGVRHFSCGHRQEGDDRDSRGFHRAWVRSRQRTSGIHSPSLRAPHDLGVDVYPDARGMRGACRRLHATMVLPRHERQQRPRALSPRSRRRERRSSRAAPRAFALELAARGDGAILVRERIGRLLLRHF